MALVLSGCLLIRYQLHDHLAKVLLRCSVGSPLLFLLLLCWLSGGDTLSCWTAAVASLHQQCEHANRMLLDACFLAGAASLGASHRAWCLLSH